MSMPASRLRLDPDTLRRLMLVGCLFVLAGLGAWRADHLTKSPAAPQLDASSFDERRLTSLLDTVVGQGRTEVRLSRRADDSWSVLVLVDPMSAENLPDSVIQSLIGSAFAVDPLSGDEVTIQRLAFARPDAATLSRQAAFELGLIGLAGALAALALLMPAGRSTDPRIAVRRSSGAGGGADRPQADPRRTKVASEVNSDPARAAAIVRDWLRGSGADA